jgi:Ca-activated chloride channel family protein
MLWQQRRVRKQEHKAMKINTQFTFNKVDFSKENDIHAVISLTAPKIEWEKKRAPICVIPVIDVSGSMAGAKIEYAKQTVLKLIDNLAPGDYCGLVAFDSDVHPIAEPRELSQGSRDQLKAKVGQLRDNSSTNFAGGMRQALEWINKADLPKNVVLRVIMLTDGHANVGEANGRDLIPLCEKLLGKATLSAFGYGTDCDQELLADLATKGKGNYAFIRNPDDALTAFAKELGGLLSMYAQNIAIDVAPVGGHKIVEVLSDVDVEEDGDKVKIKLPEILSEEVRTIVLSIKTSVQTKVLPRELNVLDVRVSYDEMAGGDKKHCEQCVKGKLEFVDAADAQKDPTKDVMAIVGIAMTVQAQIKAEELAKQNNFAGAGQVLLANAAVMDSFSLHDHGGMSRGLSAKYDSHASYSASVGYRDVMKKGLTRSSGTSDREAVEVLASVGLTSSNSAMDQQVSSFTGSPGGNVAAAAVGGGNDLASIAGSIVNSQLLQQPAPAAPQAPAAPAQKQSKSKSKSKRW